MRPPPNHTRALPTDTVHRYVIQVVLGAVSVAGTFPAFIAIERLGRRKGLLIGAAAEAVCALIAGLAGHYMLAKGNVAAADLTSRNKAGGDILIVFAVLQVFFYRFVIRYSHLEIPLNFPS